MHLGKQVRQQAVPIVVLVIGCITTVIGFLFAERFATERVTLHAQADASQYQYALQQGLRAYEHLNRDLVGFIAASGLPSERGFDTYARTADVLNEHPGLGYIGYVARVARGEPARPEAAAGTGDPGSAQRQASAASGERYPYLYGYPGTPSSARAIGLDFAAIAPRWSAMQQARDSGLSTATARHFYVTDTRKTPIVLLFTPVYDPAQPVSTVEQRRAALRGFVFSMLEIDKTIARVMGEGFYKRFDLEIYDGVVSPENLVYDADRWPHVQLADRDFPLAHHAEVTVANRRWHMFFLPKPAYLERYGRPYAPAILLLGLAGSAALSFLTSGWMRRARRRAGQRKEDERFAEVFEKHPSAVYTLDLKRRFVQANSQALAEFKIPKADLIGKSVADLIVPENRERALAAFEQVLQGISVSYESAIIDGSGARVEVSVIMVPLVVDGRVSSVLGIAQNITERKMNEWRLKESRQMLSLVINNIPQRVFWKDTHLTYLGCNQAFCDDAGLARPQDIIGKTDFELAWRANAEAYRRDDAETMREGEAKINYEERQLRDDGSESWLRTSKIPLSDINGKIVALLGLYEDVTERKLMEGQLKEMAHYDSLTGLGNRAFFYHHLELVTLRAKRRRSLVALLYLDIDKFKSINDTYGHDAGDTLLKAFAQRIKEALRDTDMAVRLGGDEFVVLLEDLPERRAAVSVAGKLVAQMQLPFRVGDIELQSGTSVGVAFLEPQMRGEELVRRADQAMYRAKRGGRNRFAIDEGDG
jgi:diguanylate cyclase (GGDEF)-like protein/PAS domain S-box-containing protein